MKKQLLLLFLILLPMMASADEIEVNGIYYKLNSVERTATVIGSYYDYTGSLDIPESISFEEKEYSVTSIGNFAFSGRSTITGIYIPNSVTTIGQDAFRGCSVLSSITIPDGVTRIEQNTFYDCSMLSSVNIPIGVTSIGENAFYNCSRLNSIIIPNSVTSIGSSVFNSCIGLLTVTLNCKEIGPWFAGSAIKEIYLGDDVRSIREYAFSDCYAIISITIPSNVISIGDFVFQGCSGLKDVYCYADVVPSTDKAAFSGSPVDNATLHVPANSVDAYKSTYPWSQFKNIEALTDQEMSIDGVTTGNTTEVARYTLDGQRTSRYQKGLNIVKMSNGTAKKVIVKSLPSTAGR